MVFYVGEAGHAFRQHRRALQVEQARQDAAITAAVKDEARTHGIGGAIFGLHVHFGAVAGVAESSDAVAEAHCRALFRRFLNQHLVKGGAAHLPGDARPGGEFAGEIEGGVALAPSKRRAVFQLEGERFGDALQGGGHVGGGEDFHAGRQQAFADDKAREMAFFQHQHLPAFLPQQGGCNRAGRPGADDDNVMSFHVISPGEGAGARWPVPKKK